MAIRTIFIANTSQMSWTVPSDWNSSNNSIEVIGGGAGGVRTTAGSKFGGGGGAYARKNNVTYTPGETITIQIGVGGAGGTSSVASSPGGETYVYSSGNSSKVVSAKPGVGGDQRTGGDAASSIGDVKYSGGLGGTVVAGGTGGGGGGAGGRNGDGKQGGNGFANGGGAGGGAGSGGSVGSNNVSGGGSGNGGAAFDTTAGGLGGADDVDGQAGSHGSGGGGGGKLNTGSGGAGGTGGNGIEWDSTHGSGGGGGASGTNATKNGGNGGLYGGGGGASHSGTKAGDGAQGLIVITYFSLIDEVSPSGITIGAIDLPKGVTGTKRELYTAFTNPGTWTVPSDWNSSNNSIETIGAGGSTPLASNSAYTTKVSNSSFTGGGGGAYARKNNITFTPGETISFTIPSLTYIDIPNAPDGVSYLPANTSVYVHRSSNNEIIVKADGGQHGTGVGGTNFGLGGQASNSIGDVKYSGGNGGAWYPDVGGGDNGGGGGGGAAGPNGPGANGGSGGTTANSGGAGGGGADGGAVGQDGQSSGIGGVGGTGPTGSPGGSPGNPSTGDQGDDGTNGSGGGGGSVQGTGWNIYTGYGGRGGSSQNWFVDNTWYGAGGGGGGSYPGITAPENEGDFFYGANGGHQGGGGGFGGVVGGNGVVVLSWYAVASNPAVDIDQIHNFAPNSISTGSPDVGKDPVEKRIFLTNTSNSTQSWFVPSDWNSSNNYIEAIGPGGASSIAGSYSTLFKGGGGGAYARKNNVPYTPGETIWYELFPTQEATSSPGSLVKKTNLWATGNSGTILSAEGGWFGNQQSIPGGIFGQGGQASSSTGDVKYSGGNGGSYNGTYGGAGGGGAAGPNGDGKNGGNASTAAAAVGNSAGGGGGGAGGGSSTAGGNASDTTGQAGSGGAAFNGTAGGAGGSSGVSGSSGSQGSGGGGGGAGGGSTVSGGTGGNGIEWDATHGAGGGGGGAGGTSIYLGGDGGLYGGGGGHYNGKGAQGIIVATWLALPDNPKPELDVFSALEAVPVNLGEITLDDVNVSQIVDMTVSEITLGTFSLGVPEADESHALNVNGVSLGSPDVGRESTLQRIFLDNPSTVTWTVPLDWNNEHNYIEAIGGGGGASSNTANALFTGGGGGAYARKNNVPYTPGNIINVVIAPIGDPGLTGLNPTGMFADNNTDIVIAAAGGTGGIGDGGNANFGRGGLVSDSAGDIIYGGGYGGVGYENNAGGGGGGAAGPNGAGKNGGNASGGSGGGGGGSNNGSAGQNGVLGNGGNGGNNFLGAGGGLGATSTGSVTSGSAGGGGGGASNGKEFAVITYGSGSSTTFAPRTNTTITAPTGISDGDTLVAIVMTVGTTSSVPEITPPAGWSQVSVTQAFSGSGTFSRAYIFKKVASGESGNYTFTHAATDVGSQGVIHRYIGSNGTVNAVSSNGGAPANTTRTATSITTTVNNCMLLYFGWDYNSSGSETPPAGMTERFDASPLYTADMLFRNTGATGNKTNTCNSSSGVPRGAWLIALEPASAGAYAGKQNGGTGGNGIEWDSTHGSGGGGGGGLSTGVGGNGGNYGGGGGQPNGYGGGGLIAISYGEESSNLPPELGVISNIDCVGVSIGSMEFVPVPDADEVNPLTATGIMFGGFVLDNPNADAVSNFIINNVDIGAPDVGKDGPTHRTYITNADVETWIVPNDWNNGDNSIEVIGGGAGGARNSSSIVGGGGGAYARTNNISYTVGEEINIKIGLGGAGGNGTLASGSGGNTYVMTSGNAGFAVFAKGGNGNNGTGGGSVAASIGTIKYAGGNGAGSTNLFSGGGGGAGGPNGAGKNSVNNGGGGAGSGGQVGVAGNGTTGGAGGAGFDGTAGGTGGNSTTSATDGFHGSGGGSLRVGETNAGLIGGNGGNGVEWSTSPDRGSGGGGGHGGNNGGSSGGDGGLYGGGGGGYGGDGAQGLIVISYNEPGTELSVGVISNLTATDVTIGSPSTPSATLNQIHGLSSTEITVGSPTVGSPFFNESNDLDVITITFGEPTIGSVSFDQIHNLTVNTVTIGSPSIPNLSIGVIRNLVANGLTFVGGMSLPLVNFKQNLPIVEITLGSMTIDSVNLSQIHRFNTVTTVTLGSFKTDTTSVGQIHNLNLDQLLQPAIVLPVVDMSFVVNTTLNGLTFGFVLPSVNAKPVYNFTVNGFNATGSFVLPTNITVSEVKNFTVVPITIGSPKVVALSLQQKHNIGILNGLTFGPILDVPILKKIFDIGEFHNLDMRSFVLDKPKLYLYNVVEEPKSTIIRNHFPQFFDFEESKLIEFIHFYYEWIENVGPDYYARNITNYNDIDSRKSGFDTFDQFLKNEFLKDFPNKMEIEQRFLIKHIKDFYRAKGSEDAVKLLFRILYNDDIEVSYPGKYILRASHGKWLIEKSMKLTLLVPSIGDINEYDYVVGTTSKATAKVQRIQQTILADKIIIEMFYDSQNGEFQVGELITSRLTGKDVAIIQELTTYPGRYTNTDGWLSSDMKLQDNRYYQEFSYVIKSGFPVSTYREQVKNLAHAAGTAMFGEFLLLVEINNVTDTNDITQLFTKQIPYDIDMFSFVQLSLTSEQTTGSFTGKYIIEYIFDGDPWANYLDYEVSNISMSGTITNGNVITSTGQFTDVQVDDVLEIYDNANNRNFYFKVKSKQSNSQITTYNQYPYDDFSGFSINWINKFAPAHIETMMYVNNAEPIVQNEIEIRDLNSFDEFRNYSFDDLRNVLVDDLDKKKFVVSNTVNFETQNIVPNSIMRIKNNINSFETYHYIRGIYMPSMMAIRDEYPYSPSNDLDYQIVNL